MPIDCATLPIRRGDVPRTRATPRDRTALRCVDTTRRHILLTGRATLYVVESRRVYMFVVGADLAVQSQQRQRMVHVTHSFTQHCLVLEQVGLVLAPCRGEGPRDATWCRGTTRCHVMQKDRVTPRRAEGPRDALWCRETSCSYGVQRNRATLYGAERPRVATACRDRATLQRTDKPRDATSCRGTERRYMVQRPRVATACRGT